MASDDIIRDSLDEQEHRIALVTCALYNLIADSPGETTFGCEPEFLDTQPRNGFFIMRLHGQSYGITVSPQDGD